MNSAAVPNIKNNAARTLFLAFTVVVSLLCLGWSLQGIDWGAFGAEVRDMDWRWVAVAIVSDILVYVWHGWRWSQLLKPIAPATMWQCVRSIYVGLYANEILPFRTGEVIRCFLMARWTDLPFPVVLSSALVERILDGIWLIVCLGFTVRFVTLPPALEVASITLIVLVAVAGALLGLVMFRKQAVHAFCGERTWMQKIQIVFDDLYVIGHSRSLAKSWLISLGYLLMQIVPIYALMQGYGLELGWKQAAAMMVILRLGSVVPQAPGNIGVFNVMATAALGIFGVDLQTSKRFAVLLWSVVTVPLLVVGFFALAITGLRVRELRHQAQTSAKPPANAV